MKTLIKRSVILSVILFNAGIVQAGTSKDYVGPCSYVNSSGRSVYSGFCQITFGVVGAYGPTNWIIRYPNIGTVVVSYDWSGTKRVTTNNIPSTWNKKSQSITSVETIEGEVYNFGNAPQ